MEIRQRGWGSCEERWPCAQLIEYLRRALGAPFIGVIADDVNGSPMLGTSRRSGLAWSAAKREKSRRTSGLLGGTGGEGLLLSQSSLTALGLHKQGFLDRRAYTLRRLRAGALRAADRGLLLA